MRKFYFLLLLFMATVTVQGQVTNPIDSVLEKKEVEGFTVYLLAAPENTYLFEIRRLLPPLLPSFTSNKLNPATQQLKGLSSKEDAYKVAGWMIGELKKNGYFPVVVPLHIIRELNLSQDPFTQN